MSTQTESIRQDKQKQLDNLIGENFLLQTEAQKLLEENEKTLKRLITRKLVVNYLHCSKPFDANRLTTKNIKIVSASVSYDKYVITVTWASVTKNVPIVTEIPVGYIIDPKTYEIEKSINNVVDRIDSNNDAIVEGKKIKYALERILTQKKS